MLAVLPCLLVDALRHLMHIINICRGAPTLAARALLSVLYGVNVATSYLLMLAVMTFNVGYFVAIVLGLALGHFIFFPVLAGNTTDLSEACCPQS